MLNFGNNIDYNTLEQSVIPCLKPLCLTRY